MNKRNYWNYIAKEFSNTLPEMHSINGKQAKSLWNAAVGRKVKRSTVININTIINDNVNNTSDVSIQNIINNAVNNTNTNVNLNNGNDHGICNTNDTIGNTISSQITLKDGPTNLQLMKMIVYFT